jgi:general secretion pathway protein H
MLPRTSVTGIPINNHDQHAVMFPRIRQTGFSLLEIMVVVVIVGIVISVASLSLGILGSDRELKTEADRFMALAEVARDEATMQSREFGIELMTAGYRFVEYDAISGQWADVPGDDTLRLRALPEAVEFELYLEGKRILLDNDPAAFDDPEKRATRAASQIYSPHLMIYSSGDATPFELRILRTYGDQNVLLRGDALGMVEVVDPDEG